MASTHLYAVIKDRVTCVHLHCRLLGRVLILLRQQQHLNVRIWRLISSCGGQPLGLGDVECELATFVGDCTQNFSFDGVVPTSAANTQRGVLINELDYIHVQ